MVFFLREKVFRARGVPRRNANKELFSWADLYTKSRFSQLHFIFRKFFTELWPLINVRIVFMRNIL